MHRRKAPSSTENVGYSKQRGILAQASRLTLVNLAPGTAMPRLHGEIAVYRTYVRRNIAHEDAKMEQQAAASKQAAAAAAATAQQQNNRHPGPPVFKQQLLQLA